MSLFSAYKFHVSLKPPKSIHHDRDLVGAMFKSHLEIRDSSARHRQFHAYNAALPQNVVAYRSVKK